MVAFNHARDGRSAIAAVTHKADLGCRKALDVVGLAAI
jgi:hypothetical protein